MGHGLPVSQRTLESRGAVASGSAGAFSTLLNHVVATGQAEQAASSVASSKLEGLDEAVANFEAFFLNYLLQSMRKTVPKGGLIDLGFAGETYTGMLDQALSEEMAKAGGIGLARILIEQLS